MAFCCPKGNNRLFALATRQFGAMDWHEDRDRFSLYLDRLLCVAPVPFFWIREWSQMPRSKVGALDKKREDGKVVSIRDGKPIPSTQSSKYYGKLTSKDPKLNRLLENYFKALGLEKSDRTLARHELALTIQNFETDDPMDLMLKLTVLESELGWGPDILSHESPHERLLFAYFRRALIQYIEEMTRKSV